MNDINQEKGITAEHMAVREFRTSAGLTLEQVAKMAGLSKSMLSLYEAGKRNLSEAAREKLFDALKDIRAGKNEAKRLDALRRSEAAKIVDRYISGVEKFRLKRPDFDEVVGPKFPGIVPPKEPSELELWRAQQIQEYYEFLGSEFYNDILRKEVSALKDQLRAKHLEITAKDDEIASLRDLLNLKTEECLLREKLLN